MVDPGDAARRAFSRALLDEIGHEFRTPLSSILGHQELLREGILGELDGKVAGAVDRIGVAALQLTHLVNGAVDLAGLALGEAPQPDAEPVSLAHVNAAAEAYARAAAGENGDLQIDAGAESVLVKTDPRRLDRVLVLATTAVLREVPAGSLSISLLDAPDDDAGSVRASWSGPGGAWLWVPEAAPDPAAVLSAALLAVSGVEGERLPGSWLRLAVAAVTAALIGGTLRFREGADASRLELLLPVGTPPV